MSSTSSRVDRDLQRAHAAFVAASTPGRVRVVPFAVGLLRATALLTACLVALAAEAGRPDPIDLRPDVLA